MRDAFEDYDLLTLLESAYKDTTEAPEDLRILLDTATIIPNKRTFSIDDYEYTRCHTRILELLEGLRP
jgi:hypothetical protein